MHRSFRKVVGGPGMSVRLLLVFSLVTVLGFSAVCGSVLLDMRRSAEELARQTLENLAASVDSDIHRNIEMYDASLRDVAANLLLPELKVTDPAIQQLILFDRSTTAAHFSPIEVYDAEGNLIRSATTPTPPKLNRRTEPFFTIHRDEPYHGLFISKPMETDGNSSITLSRRVSGPEGQFLGVVAGAIRYDYFRDLFAPLRLAPRDVIAVIARDGTMIMRTPLKPELIGRNMLSVPGVKRMLTDRHGWFSGPGAFDDTPRMFVWADGSRPLVVLVGRSWTDILQLWREEAIRIGAILLALAVFVAAVTVVFIREIQRRAEAERRLEELATTDPLTGLTNRRKFDAAIDGEWRRATRHDTPVALLMIDADHFKNFNDGFGHQAGDQMLVGIAVCIADSVRRAGDCAARFGGEEFAVLLPGLSGAAAEAMAETIRQKVEQWSDAEGGVTVSIGVASLTPKPSQHWGDLVEAADRALYAAKDLGRNRCVVATAHSEFTLVA